MVNVITAMRIHNNGGCHHRHKKFSHTSTMTENVITLAHNHNNGNVITLAPIHNHKQILSRLHPSKIIQGSTLTHIQNTKSSYNQTCPHPTRNNWPWHFCANNIVERTAVKKQVYCKNGMHICNDKNKHQCGQSNATITARFNQSNC